MRHTMVEIIVLAASILTLACSIGVARMKDPYQRLHFISPPTALAAPMLVAAVFLEEPQLIAGFKTAAVAVLLVLINAVVTHATARAVRVRERGRWQPGPGEDIEIVHEAPAARGASRAAKEAP